MTVSSFITILQKIIDISLVWILIYYALKSLKNNVKMVLIFKGIIIIVVIKILSDVLNLTTVGLLLEYVIMWGPLALIIIFQPEIRNLLEHLGRKQILTKHHILTMDEREKMIYEIMNAIDYLRKSRIGALIVIEREVSLNDYIVRSKAIYADISNELLVSIFFPRNPLHDGGVIIQGNRITSAGAVFPISLNTKINKRLGTRHRAALGISEESDAIAIVVSEETGKISIAIGGVLNHGLSIDDVRIMLVEELRPKRELLLDDEFENEEENTENSNLKDGEEHENN
ncbi:MAG: diadenylate cyclase CdaA [Bacilli bacterium]|nr:diadenylate cyclase CdaA [Bacilli bacterium]